MAPGDRAAQCSLSLGQVPGAPCQHVQAGRQAVQDDGRREQPDPRRRQLDREGQSFKPLHDLPDCGEVLVRHDRVGAHEASAIQEQLHPARQIQGRHLVLVLARHAEDLAAGDDDPQPRSGTEQRGDVLRG